MKILICHQYALAPHHAGVTRHFMLGRELARRGHQVTIIAASTSHKNPDACRLADSENYRLEKYEGVDFIWLRTPTASPGKIARVWNMLVFAWRLRRIPWREEPDIVIGNTPDPFTAVAALHLARATGVPYILHIGDLWPLSLMNIGGIPIWHPFILLLSLLERYLYSRADAIITPLPHAAKYIISRGGKAEKIAHVPIVADLDTGPPPFSPNDVFTFISAGSIGPGNGVETLVRAAENFEKRYPDRDYRLRVIGEGPEKKRLAGLAQALKIKNLSFEGAYPRNKIHNVLLSADAFIINVPNHDVFRIGGISPNKVFDYFLAARPVIIGCSAANNPVDEAGAGLSVTADSAEMMADAMTSLMDMTPEMRAKIGGSGRAYVERHHNILSVTEGLEGLIISLIQGNSSYDRKYGH